MEQELAEAVQRREEDGQLWAERAGGADAELAALRTSLQALEVQNEGELASLREAEHVSQEALEKEKVEVARLEKELALMKEAEIVAQQASQEASGRDGAEIDRLRHELLLMKDAVERAGRDASDKEKVEREREEAQKKEQILAEIWRQLQSTTAEDVHGAEELPLPADPSLLVLAVQSVQDQLMRLRDEHSQTRAHCDEFSHTMASLQGKNKNLTLNLVWFLSGLVISRLCVVFRTTGQEDGRRGGSCSQDTRAGAADCDGQC